MKKLLIIPALAAVAACDSADKVQNVTVLGVECEVIATGEMGDILAKCPMDAGFEPMRAQAATAKFVSAGKDVVNLAELAADAEHVYINVVENDCGENTIGNRIMVKDAVIDEESMYAAVVCEGK